MSTNLPPLSGMTLGQTILWQHINALRAAASFLEGLQQVGLEHVGINGDMQDLAALPAGEGEAGALAARPIDRNVLCRNSPKNGPAVRAKVAVVGSAENRHAGKRSVRRVRGKTKTQKQKGVSR